MNKRQSTRTKEAVMLVVIILVYLFFKFVYTREKPALNDDPSLTDKQTVLNDDLHLSLIDKIASLSRNGIKDYQNCVVKGQAFKDFIKDDTNIKDFCVNQIYGKEKNLSAVKIDPMIHFFYLIRDAPEYEKIFIDCTTTKKAVAEEFLINQAKNEKEEDSARKKLKWKIGQSCAKEIVDKL